MSIKDNPYLNGFGSALKERKTHLEETLKVVCEFLEKLEEDAEVPEMTKILSSLVDKKKGINKKKVNLKVARNNNSNIQNKRGLIINTMISLFQKKKTWKSNEIIQELRNRGFNPHSAHVSTNLHRLKLKGKIIGTGPATYQWVSTEKGEVKND